MLGQVVGDAVLQAYSLCDFAFCHGFGSAHFHTASEANDQAPKGYEFLEK